MFLPLATALNITRSTGRSGILGATPGANRTRFGHKLVQWSCLASTVESFRGAALLRARGPRQFQILCEQQVPGEGEAPQGVMCVSTTKAWNSIKKIFVRFWQLRYTRASKARVVCCQQQSIFGAPHTGASARRRGVNSLTAMFGAPNVWQDTRCEGILKSIRRTTYEGNKTRRDIFSEV